MKEPLMYHSNHNEKLHKQDGNQYPLEIPKRKISSNPQHDQIRDNKRRKIDHSVSYHQTVINESRHKHRYLKPQVSNSNINHQDLKDCLKQEQLIKDLRSQRETIDVKTYNKYLNLLYKCQRFDQADQIYDEVKHENIANDVTLNTMLKIQGARSSKEARTFFDKEIGDHAVMRDFNVVLEIYVSVQVPTILRNNSQINTSRILYYLLWQ
jgi:hypothetical protein